MPETQPNSNRPRRTAAVLIGIALAVGVCGGIVGAQEVESDTPTPQVEQRRGDMISVFSGDIHIPANVRQRGSIVCVGGTATVEGEVTQDVIVVLGNLELTGTVGGEVISVLSDQQLTDARVRRDMISVLGTLELERTQVSGELVNILSEFNSDADSNFSGPQNRIGLPWFPSIWSLVFWGRLVMKLFVFVLLLLLVALVSDRIRVIGDEAPVRYVSALFVGLLGYLGLCIVLSLLSVTLVGLPLALVAFYVLRWMGIAGVFFAVGRRLAGTVGREMSVLGSVLLVYAIYVVISLSPTPLGPWGLIVSALLWMIFFVFVDLPAIGLLILTRLGSPRMSPPPAPTPAGPPLAGPAPQPAPLQDDTSQNSE